MSWSLDTFLIKTRVCITEYCFLHDMEHQNRIDGDLHWGTTMLLDCLSGQNAVQALLYRNVRKHLQLKPGQPP